MYYVVWSSKFPASKNYSQAYFFMDGRWGHQ